MNSRRLHHVLAQPKCGGLSRLCTAVASSDCLSSTDDSDKILSTFFDNAKEQPKPKRRWHQVPREHICIVELCMHTHTHTITYVHVGRPSHTWGDTFCSSRERSLLGRHVYHTHSLSSHTQGPSRSRRVRVHHASDAALALQAPKCITLITHWANV